MTAAAIEVRNLDFRYQPHLGPVLRGVDLRVERGDFVALLGQNGAGKTTLAKHFNGLLRPSAGEVLVDGKATTRQKLDKLARSVGYCYQNPDHQIFSATVEKEVRFGPHNLGVRGEALNSAANEALELVGLSDQRTAHPFSLGRGQRQLLAVASVLAMGPPILVVDEPTTGMDHIGAQRIMDLLASWNRDGRTILVITHDMDIVAEYVPRSVVMTGGRVIADGPTVDVLRERDVLTAARLQAPGAVRMSDALADSGITPCTTVAGLADQVRSRLEVANASRL
ncbi:MAG: ATP-binding cassette domain-containing protein [Euzebyales bacterium]|nr:ATP-binding cassette domain-containing protein [Euzebyales bacterium]MBA3621724.1 ATP-binding cassette domain-containing protein [Euzebyales bacterium]